VTPKLANRFTIARMVTVQDMIEELRAALPPIWLGVRSGELSGGAFHWPSIQNKRAKREIPNAQEIFVRSGHRVLVRRDPFLAWWKTTLSDAGSHPLTPPRRSRRRDRDAETPRAAG
jgi:hypothetical protein